MFSAGWATAAVECLGWFGASCRAKARSQPHLSRVSHLSGAVVGCEVANPPSRPHRLGLLSARRDETPVLQQPARANKPEIPGPHIFPSFASQAAVSGALKNRLCPTPHELTENCRVLILCLGLARSKCIPRALTLTRPFPLPQLLGAAAWLQKTRDLVSKGQRPAPQFIPQPRCPPRWPQRGDVSSGLPQSTGSPLLAQLRKALPQVSLVSL